MEQHRVNTHIRKGERKPHILWACFNCLIDHTSGASLSVREALSQLSHFGYKVTILGATIFDSVSGSNRINSIREEIGISNGSFITINDYPLKHKLLCTNSSNKLKLSVIEQDIWFNEYLRLLDSTKPDVVFFYGGNNIDSMISYESKLRNIPVAFYLANNNYYGHRWHRDIDLILCDTESSAKMHKNVNGYNAKPIGKFIPPELVVAENHMRERILFICPTIEKGAALVVLLALVLQDLRPDIKFEVIQNRGDWASLVEKTTVALGATSRHLDNVIISPATHDMKAVYSRARVLLAPSLCWESGGRVWIEALMNGIPVIATDHGAAREIIGDSGVLIHLPEKYHTKPYHNIPSKESLAPLAELLIRLFDDELFFNELSARAMQHAAQNFNMKDSVRRLDYEISNLIDKGEQKTSDP